MFSRADQIFTLKFDFWEIFNSELVYFVQLENLAILDQMCVVSLTQ